MLNWFLNIHFTKLILYWSNTWNPTISNDLIQCTPGGNCVWHFFQLPTICKVMLDGSNSGDLVFLYFLPQTALIQTGSYSLASLSWRYNIPFLLLHTFTSGSSLLKDSPKNINLLDHLHDLPVLQTRARRAINIMNILINLYHECFFYIHLSHLPHSHFFSIGHSLPIMFLTFPAGSSTASIVCVFSTWH